MTARFLALPLLGFFVSLEIPTAVHPQQSQLGIVSVELVDHNFRPTVQSAKDPMLRFAVRFRVLGSTTKPFAIRATLDGASIVQDMEPHEPGDHTRIYTFDKPVMDTATFVVTLDPKNESGATNSDYRRFEQKVDILHDPSAPAITRFGTINYQLREKVIVKGLTPRQPVTVQLSSPRTSSICEVVQGDPRVTKTPESDEVKGVADENGQYEFERLTRVRCSAVCVNPLKLRQTTWSQIEADKSQNRFLEDGTKLDVKEPAVENFVRSALGTDYRARLTPFDAAQRVFRRIKASLRFEVTDIYQPSKTLALGKGQCASGNRLLCAALRSMGIPARTMGGFWGPKSDGGHEGHRICEFYLAGQGWIPCDATPFDVPSETSVGFGNFNGSNLYVTWDDDAKYECGFGFPGKVIGSGSPKTSVKMELRRE